MQKKGLSLILALLLVVPFAVHASDEDFYVVASETKYYKTIHYAPEVSTFSADSNALYKTVEISKDEYDAVNTDDNAVEPCDATGISTEYKYMETSILANGSHYRYKNILLWKKYRKTRSYDIMSIGYPSNVKPYMAGTFSQYYCIAGGSCKTESNGSFLNFDNAIGVSFKLPSGTLTSLKETLYFDVKKNTNATITAQSASGDYAHAQKTTTLTESKKYSASTSGIYLASSVRNKYDEIPEAHVSWNGSW